jgi:hypothetical protein
MELTIVLQVDEVDAGFLKIKEAVDEQLTDRTKIETLSK